MSYGKLLVIGLAIILSGFYILNNIVSVYPNLHGNDFAHLYLGAVLAKQSRNFYSPEELFSTAQSLGIQRLNPFVYPPVVALFFIPLSFFSYPSAHLVWFILNHLFLICGLTLLISSFSSSATGAPTTDKLIYYISALILTFNFYPLYRTLTAGQLNLLILFLISLTWFLFARKKSVGAGIFLGIATLIKLFPGLLLLFFLWKKEYKVAVSAVATIAILVLISLAIQGVQPYQDYGTLLTQMSYGQSVWSEFQQRFDVEPANQSFHALVARLFIPNPVTEPLLDLPQLARMISLFFSIIILLLTFYFTYNKKKNEQQSIPFLQLEYSFFLLSALLIPNLLWDHYLVYSFLILLCLINYWFESNKITLKSILYISILFLIMAMPFNFWSPMFRSDFGIFLMSIKLYPVLLLWIYLAVTLFSTRKKVISVGAGFPCP
ncbi:MAG: glycosyltransferase family 87 protein [bacterium]|nr:glycosyltransferase family 87 protein [bacterium]